MLVRLIDERSTTYDFVVILIANKIDLVDERLVEEEDEMLSILAEDPLVVNNNNLYQVDMSVKAEIGIEEASVLLATRL